MRQVGSQKAVRYALPVGPPRTGPIESSPCFALLGEAGPVSVPTVAVEPGYRCSPTDESDRPTCLPSALHPHSPATCWSSAAAPPARRSPRCWPSQGRDVVAAREGAPPALPHRRIAAAGQRRAVRAARRARPRSSAIGMQKWGVEFVSPDHDAQELRRVRRGLGQVDAVRLAGAPLRVRRDPVPPRRAERRAHVRGLPRARRSRSTPTARPSQVEAEGRRAAAAGARASSSTPRAATRCSPTSSSCKQKNPRHNSAALYGHFRGVERAARQARRQHHHLLVRARLVLVHPARRRHDQHRRGLLAVLPEVAQQAAARVLRRHDRAVPGARRAARATPSSSTTGLRDRQLLVQRARISSGERYLMLGDAYAFIDPVFSSGVYLAMHSAFDGARRRRGRARPAGATRRPRGAASTR